MSDIRNENNARAALDYDLDLRRLPPDLQARKIDYNHKLDPKYDLRAGRDVVFADPREGKGDSLIGHELSHVVQQK